MAKPKNTTIVTVADVARAVLHGDRCPPKATPSMVHDIVDGALRGSIGLMAMCSDAPVLVALGNGYVLVCDVRKVAA
jgi:hypothetical protein